jgi:hypothetical protein
MVVTFLIRNAQTAVTFPSFRDSNVEIAVAFPILDDKSSFHSCFIKALISKIATA